MVSSSLEAAYGAISAKKKICQQFCNLCKNKNDTFSYKEPLRQMPKSKN